MQQKSIFFITTADTDILTADRALASQPAGFPRVVAVNPSSLAGSAGAEGGQPADDTLSRASEAGVVVLRLLGGKRAMPDTFDALVRQCRSDGIPLIACPGHQEWDEDLITACTAPVAEVEAVFAYLMQGGVQNFQNLFLFLSDTYFGTDYGHEAPAPLPWEGIYHPDVADGTEVESYVAQRFPPGRPSIGILFYRAHWMSGNLLPIDALVRSLETKGANVLPVYAFSLKHSPQGDGVANRAFTEYMASPDGTPRVQCIINTMGMSMGELSTEGPAIATGWSVDYLNNLNVPMVQAIISTGTQDEWLESNLGLGPIDTAMSVALPEFDGRLIAVPISFKEEALADGSGGLSGRLQRYVPREDRVELVARLAIKQANLALKLNSEKKIALILSNYPTKDARIGNAVGLDTPASAVLVLNALKDAGYSVTDIPKTGDELVHRIIERCSNDRDSLTEEQLRLAAEYPQRALGEGPVLHLNPQGYFPAEVKVGPSLGLGIADLVVGLEQKGRRQQAGRHAVPAVVGAVEFGELGVPEQPAPQRREETIEAFPPHVVQVQPVRFPKSPLVRSPSQHSPPPLHLLTPSIAAYPATDTFRPDF